MCNLRRVLDYNIIIILIKYCVTEHFARDLEDSNYVTETKGSKGHAGVARDLQRGVNVSLFHRAVLMLRICSVFRPTRRQSFDVPGTVGKKLEEETKVSSRKGIVGTPEGNANK